MKLGIVTPVLTLLPRAHATWEETGTFADAANTEASVKTVVCRTVQEGLSNGWRHGRGAEQSVDLVQNGSQLVLSVRDRGPGPGAPSAATDAMTGLGLPGLKGRAEALGGTVTLRARSDGPGAELVLELDLEEVPG